MSDVSKIVGNQQSRDKHATKERESNKSNWQSGWGRAIIALLLVAIACYIAAQELGFFYTLLIALAIWWVASTAEEKLSKSEQYKDLVWHWPSMVKAAAALTLVLTLVQTPLVEQAGKGIERLVEGAQPAYTATDTNWLHNPYTGKVFKTEPQNGCRSRGDCYDPNHSDGNGGTNLVKYDATKVATLTQKPPRRKSTPAPIIVPTPLTTTACTNSKYVNSGDCENIMFNVMNAQYARAKKDKDLCVGFDPQNSVIAQEDPDNPGVYLFKPKYLGAIVNVYDIAPGQRVAGFRCNPS